MKFTLALLIAIPLFLGCGHLSGNNPEGVTGGGSNGYGSFGTSFSGGDGPVQLLGTWRQNGDQGAYNIVTFGFNGIVRVDFYNGNLHQSQNGTYYLSGSRIDLNVSGWENGSGIVAINGDVMSVTFDNGTIVLHKTS